MTLTTQTAPLTDAPQPDFVAEAAALFPGGGIGPSDATLRTLYPAMIHRAEGPWLHTSEGEKLLDFVMGGSALILGHGDAHVAAAVAEQVGRGTHYYQILHEPALRFAAKLVETIPVAEKLIYTSTGSDAVQQAVRLARAKTGRPGVLKFTGAYHGTNDVALVGMSSPQGRNAGQADAGGIDPAGLGNVFAVARDDLARVETLLRLEGDRIACVLIDPLQRWLKPDPAFLTGLRALCDQYGVLLVFDEVVTGFRLSLGGAQALWNVTPDIAAYGKIIGGGLPLGAVVGPAEIMDMADARSREAGTAVATSGTFNANVLACTAGLATVERLCTPGLYEGLAEKGAALRHEMQAILDQNGIAAVVGGEASFWHVTFGDHEPTTYEDNLGMDLERARALDRALLTNGIFVMPNGRRSLSVAHGPEEIAYFLSVFDDICKKKAF
ncbi:aspartate aminotransferase family protein [Pseudooceanicola nanhaiensis]|uniref:aspartate aminotransferase family protein n=1 Tax=Pseudooceanicola nanhaiensis TaxID=375761 RepID=UPI001CD4B94D|nr:aminotransferase class III-fold pyridoxal phosphate-dependent enzyme [Pseudooceanicola nanhaiensis]MCA0919272.1 aminotransferase class III-fold pyridoxal phosphate-dependent enzyme [Pseudooceanicola nanhaiensis]